MKKKINDFFIKMDNMPLWLFIIPLAIVNFMPYFIAKENSVFPIHDQLDETFLSYLLTARHLFDGSDYLPEILGGLQKNGLQPSAPLFLPLYRITSPFWAFLVQYIIIFITAFLGMYFCIKELTNSSIISTGIAICFSMLPFQPIYGNSLMGIPIAVLAIIYLSKQKNFPLSIFLLIYYALTAHLVLSGFVVIGFWGLFLIYLLIGRKRIRENLVGFIILIISYILGNLSLFTDFIFQKNGFVSHREEFVNHAAGFLSGVKDVLIPDGYLHTPSLHNLLIIPIVIAIILGLVLRKRLSDDGKRLQIYSIVVAASIVLVAIANGFVSTELVANWQNSQQGILHYFSFNRITFIAPTLWYAEAGICIAIIWDLIKKVPVIQISIAILILLPTFYVILSKSYFYMQINQKNNGSEITGYVTWKDYFAEDIFEKIDEEIGLDKSEYRIAHLGIAIAPSIAYGFYSIDGYSNNYPLEFKHEFREVIENEIEKNDYLKTYYDDWGSRCYLFNNVTGNYMMLAKNKVDVYSGLELNFKKLYEMGCRYIFSGLQIEDSDELGLEFVGYFDSEDSYWGIWVYKL